MRRACARMFSSRNFMLLEHSLQPTPSPLCGLASWPPAWRLLHVPRRSILDLALCHGPLGTFGGAQLAVKLLGALGVLPGDLLLAGSRSFSISRAGCSLVNLRVGPGQNGQILFISVEQLSLNVASDSAKSLSVLGNMGDALGDCGLRFVQMCRRPPQNTPILGGQISKKNHGHAVLPKSYQIDELRSQTSQSHVPYTFSPTALELPN